MDDCIFCSIVSGQTPADVVYETDGTLFFRDISPKAAVHILGIPKQHIVSLAAVSEETKELVGKLMHDASRVARDVGIDEGGYRLITNVGGHAGQEVKHLHVHVLGGESLGPLRC